MRKQFKIIFTHLQLFSWILEPLWAGSFPIFSNLTQFTTIKITFYIYCLDNELYRTKILAFCFDSECGTLLKHGDYDRINNYSKTMRAKLVKSGFIEFASRITVICSDQWDIDVINKFIECSGFILKWYNQSMAGVTW